MWLQKCHEVTREAVWEPSQVFTCYKNQIKRITKIQPGDASAFRRLLNFLKNTKAYNIATIRIHWIHQM